MQEQLGQASEIYNLVVTFLVNYSFQILGAILILIIGIFLAGKISNWLFGFCQSKNLDITLSRFIANVVKLLFILMVGIIGGTSWMSTARIVRGEVLSIKEEEFVLASRSIGTRS